MTTIAIAVSFIRFRIIRRRFAHAQKLAIRSMAIDREALLALGRHFEGAPS